MPTGTVQSRRVVLYDNIAMAVAMLPLPFVFPTALTGPLTVFLVFWCWRRHAPPLGRSRVRLYLAGVLGLAETGVWLVIITLALADHL